MDIAFFCCVFRVSCVDNNNLIVDKNFRMVSLLCMSKRAATHAIREFILEAVDEHEGDLVRHIVQTLKISRQAVNRHLRSLQSEGVVVASGNTKSRRYNLKEIVHLERWYSIENLEEHVPWQNDFKPHLMDLPGNVREICSYGFSEMLNNAIDHSQSATALVELTRTPSKIKMQIFDTGIGIFKKIQKELNLDSEFLAICELAKGKLTTDPDHHTGEGIFFTSRMFDEFSILSGELYFSHRKPDNDWLIEDRHNERKGTLVTMVISSKSLTVYRSVFDSFTSGVENDNRFSKTHVPVKLMQYGSDNLVSRSQARRVLSRFELFDEIILDFVGVQMIGQGFADEIFRVFNLEHHNTKIIPINAVQAVQEMINHAISNRTSKPSLLQKNLFPDEPTAFGDTASVNGITWSSTKSH